MGSSSHLSSRCCAWLCGQYVKSLPRRTAASKALFFIALAASWSFLIEVECFFLCLPESQDITMQYCCWHRTMNVILSVRKTPLKAMLVQRRFIVGVAFGSGMWLTQCCTEVPPHSQLWSLPFYAVNLLPLPSIFLFSRVHSSLSWLCQWLLWLALITVLWLSSTACSSQSSSTVQSQKDFR